MQGLFSKYVFYFISWIFFFSSKFVLTQISVYFNENLSVNLTLGTVEISLPINFAQGNIIIGDCAYNPRNSNTSVLVNNNYNYYPEYKDYLSFNAGEPTLMHFKFEGKIDVWTPSIKGIGFHLKSSEKSSFFLNILKQKNYIDKIGFSLALDKIKELDKRKLIFGSVPNEIAQTHKSQGKCLVGKNATNWSCALSYVQFGKEMYTINEPIFFDESKTFLTVPPHFFEGFPIKYLKNKIKNDICIRESDPFSFYDRIECNCKEITDLPNMEFVFENTILSINSKLLFFQNNEKCVYKIEREEVFGFGVHFLEYFTTYFDFEEKSISFYSNNIEIKSTIDYSLNKVVILSLILILIIPTIFLSYIKLNPIH